MALDSRIPLGVTPTNVQNTFSSALTNLSKLESLKQQQAQNPLQNKLLEARVDQAESNISVERENRRQQSLFDLSTQIKPLLDSGDTTSAMQLLESRMEGLKRNNIPTADSEELLNMVISDPIQAMNAVNAAVELGRQKGLSGISQQGLTAGQRERQSLLATLDDPNASEVAKQSARIALGTEAKVGTSAQERIATNENLKTSIVDLESDIAGGKEGARLGEQLEKQPLITKEIEQVKTENALKRETQASNIKRMSELQSGEKSREASIKKASQFLRALESGDAHSGATRSTLSFVPGVFTSQAQFDERFNAFAEVAARQQLKAAGEIRPTDADVEGMKRAMFGVGRDEQTNIQLLNEFISAQRDQADELDDLKESRKNKTLDQFGIKTRVDNGELTTEEQLELEALKAEFGVQ